MWRPGSYSSIGIDSSTPQGCSVASALNYLRGGLGNSSSRLSELPVSGHPCVAAQGQDLSVPYRGRENCLYGGLMSLVGQNLPVDHGSRHSRKQSHTDPYALLIAGPTITNWSSYAVASPAQI
jgi:hypothetical protein